MNWNYVECVWFFIEYWFWREFEMHSLKKIKTMEFLWQITKNSFESKTHMVSAWRSMPHLFDISYSLILIVVYFEKTNSCNLLFLFFSPTLSIAGLQLCTSYCIMKCLVFDIFFFLSVSVSVLRLKWNFFSVRSPHWHWTEWQQIPRTYYYMCTTKQPIVYS